MLNSTLFLEMTRWFAGDIRRINHFIKVAGFARAIGEAEGLDDETMRILDAVGLTHDIGIRVSEEKYGSSSGKLQEQEGPAVAREMLARLGHDSALVDRVCFLIGHHHTYSAIDGVDFQILVEADFLVNLDEEHASSEAIGSVRRKYFRTAGGLRLLDDLFPIKAGADAERTLNGS